MGTVFVFQLNFHDGRDIKDVQIPSKFSVLKPLQAKWITDLFNYVTSEKGWKTENA